MAFSILYSRLKLKASSRARLIRALAVTVKDDTATKATGEKMTTTKKNLRTCSKGHKYYKSSDCPTCPICEQERKPETGFLSLLVAPARRALEREGITTLAQLSKYSEDEILELHGMGPSTIPKLRRALKAKGLTFRNK